MNIKYFFFVITLISNTICFAQEKILYKQIDSTELFLEVYYPEQVEVSKTYPAMVFFFGGGWKGGRLSLIHI